MRPIEIQMLTTGAREHLRRQAILEFIELAELTPGQHADHKEFDRLNTLWLMARDEQRLVQQEYAAQLQPGECARLAP